MKYLIFGIFFILINSNWALECPTCSGDDCNGAIAVVECTKNTQRLPFKLTKSPDVQKSDYKCLNLEYFKDDEIHQIRQCHLVEENRDLCKVIRESLNEYSSVVACSTSKTEDIQPLGLEEEGSGHGGAITNIISFLSVFFVLLFKIF